ncbi:MAG: glycosyltransferase family 4 protein, partial [Actinomycetota bacterium]|nr:glycosyltransferase family 4 protein [Actinomycetota bacterium]
ATVYDFIPWRFPNQYLHTSWRRFLYRRYLDHLRRATHLMAISQAVAADASEVLGRDPEAVTVTPLGVPPLPDPGEASPAESYLFLAATPQPHKNLRFALETVGALPASVRPPVVVTGYQGDRRWGPILALAAQRGVTLEHRGHVSRRELSTLYAGAAAVLVTSDYEGFGLPVVEALSVGARVLCSDRGALPEVAGPAEVLPLKREAWTLRLREVLGGEPHNPEPGRRWAARFTWERTARATLEAYRRLA